SEIPFFGIAPRRADARSRHSANESDRGVAVSTWMQTWSAPLQPTVTFCGKKCMLGVHILAVRLPEVKARIRKFHSSASLPGEPTQDPAILLMKVTAGSL